MVEVFKTNVTQKKVAQKILVQLHREFAHYRANFDLGDVDRILRIVYGGARVDVEAVIRILNAIGFEAEVLPDVPLPQPVSHTSHLKNKLQIAF